MSASWNIRSQQRGRCIKRRDSKGKSQGTKRLRTIQKEYDHVKQEDRGQVAKGFAAKLRTGGFI